MASEKSIKVFEKFSKTVKGKSIIRLKEVKTDGTLLGSKKVVVLLQKSGVAYFEVVDQKNGRKTEYKKTISGKNYEVKTVNI